jgi:hypothetical protein
MGHVIEGKDACKNGANWRADGARQTTRMAGRKKDVGTHNLSGIQIHL